MTTLVFLLAVAAIVAAILTFESSPGGSGLHRPAGLLTWVVSGNWPAKIGGILILVGSGALLRYAALHVDVAPSTKLSLGVVIAAALGFGSALTSKGPAQRALSLSLGGAAFGVVYLTAYSAFALFGFLDSTTGIGLLLITAAATGFFAVNRNALSLAVLAMIGAYLAPAFSTTDPGTYITYGYYAAATVLTLGMVALRGWRPLIHLSFLFTLAGGLFFAWTAHYYNPQHFHEMAPMIWLLVFLHVFLPLVERGGDARGLWLERLDTVYLLALPVVAALLAVAISPSRASLSVLLIALSFAWIVAALFVKFTARQGMAAHAGIALFLFAIGIIARFRNLPWDVIALALAVGALALTVYRLSTRNLDSFLAGLVLVLGGMHALNALSPATGTVFINASFIERLVAAGLLIFAAHLCRKVRQSLDTVLLYAGIGWALLAVISEMIRWDLFSIAFALHLMLLAASAATLIPRSRLRVSGLVGLILVVGTLVTAAASSAPSIASIITLFVAPLSLLALAMRQPADGIGSDRAAAVVSVPIVAAIWAQHVDASSGIANGYFLVTAAAAAATLSLIAADTFRERSRGWIDLVATVLGFAFALTMLVITTGAIGRSAWAITAELVGVSGLALLAFSTQARTENEGWLRSAFVIATGLLLQAHLLRWLGPSGDLTIMDVADMKWPALVSLLWAAMGAALTLWARKASSRTLWIGGATLLVAAAVKVVLVDFGSLGELENILAVIAAGVVFLLVGWLAPMPPAAPRDSEPTDVPPKDDNPDTPERAAGEPLSARKSSSAPHQAARSHDAPITTSAPEADQSAGRVMPESYWNRREQQTPAIDTSDDSSETSRKTVWTIGLIAVGAFLMARCGAPLLQVFERSPPQTPPNAGAVVEPPPDTRLANVIPGQSLELREPVPEGVVVQGTTAMPPAAEGPDGGNSAQLPARAPGSFFAPTSPSVERLIEEGKLRRATRADLEQWLATHEPTPDQDVLRIPEVEGAPWRTYVVLAPITFPTDRYGAHYATFIVPAGVPYPQGDPGHSQVLDMNE